MRIVFFILTVFTAMPGRGQVFTLTKDIFPGTGNGTPANYLCAFNGKLYFPGNDNASTNNIELWASDGTTAGTVLIKEIDPVNGSNPNFLTVLNGKLVFAAGDGVNGYEIWYSDGTTAGTNLLKDINPGIAPSFPTTFYTMNNTLFFIARTPAEGSELWKTDGTPAGTVMVKDIYPGTGSSVSTQTSNFYLAMNGYLYFSADDGVNGLELWKTDGTAANTVMVKDINPGVASSGSIFGLLNMLQVLNNEIYFLAISPGAGGEIWKSDGTAAGTVMVKDIYPGTTSAFPGTAVISAVLNGAILVSANDGVYGQELWKTDGTNAGTQLVKDIYVGATGNGNIYPFVFNNYVYFIGNDGVNGAELWRSDGTTAGTTLFKDINPGATGSFPTTFRNIGGVMVFAATTTANGSEPWRSDGTSANTVMIEDVVPGTGSSSAQSIMEIDGTVYAIMRTPATGYELWAGSLPVVIPLRLLEFKGTIVKNDVQLNWKTAEEVNTRNFIIERSLDGISFTGIGAVDAANETGTQQYYYTDQSATTLAAKKIFYRLKQQDIDGKFTYSPVISLNFSVSNFSMTLYPNPVKEITYVQINATKKQTITLRLFDISGKLLQHQVKTLNAGNNYMPIQTVSFAKGLYKISVQAEETQKVLSFVKN